MSTLQITKSDFSKEVLESDVPVIADFWAPWCGPCRMMAPIFEQAAGKLSGKVKFVKVNVDDESDIAAEFGVMTIPTLIVFKDGKEAKRSVGVISESELLSLL